MAKDTPTFTAYSVFKREGQDDFWQPIGAAFDHADGKGMNLILHAIPVPQDGQVKIVLREPKDERTERSQRHAERREPRSNERQGAEDVRDRPARSESRSRR